MKRGIHTVADLRARYIVNHNTGCWIWQGAKVKGAPRLWGFDHTQGKLRVMTGPMAVWNLAHKEAPRKGNKVFRRCMVTLCLCPVHMGQARNPQEIGTHIRLNGARKGTAVEQRRANLAKAHVTIALTATPREIVIALRSAGPEVTTAALAKLHGIGTTTVSRIRRMQSHRDVV